MLSSYCAAVQDAGLKRTKEAHKVPFGVTPIPTLVMPSSSADRFRALPEGVYGLNQPEGARGAMADLNERDTKLVQYLSEAYGKERELVGALETHISMTT